MQVKVRPEHLTSMALDIWNESSKEVFPFETADELKQLTWDGHNLALHSHTIASFAKLTDLEMDILIWTMLLSRYTQLATFPSSAEALSHGL